MCVCFQLLYDVFFLSSHICIYSIAHTAHLFFFFFRIDLSPSESYIDAAAAPTLHLRAYSVNQKGRSEPTVLEDIAINEAEKRTGTYTHTHTYLLPFLHAIARIRSFLLHSFYTQLV